MRRGPFILLLLCACREPGVYVQFVAEPSVPPLDRLRVMVLQNGELLIQDRESFPLTGLTLPQTVRVGSSSGNAGPVDIVAQGFVGSVVQARGEVMGTLTRDAPYEEVTLVLVRLCSGTDCGATPTTCAAQNASCGTVDDLAGGFLDCGHCPGGQTCGGGGPHRCGTSACTPTATCASLNASCGFVFDGCKMSSCGSCDAPLQCDAQRSCSCTPRVSCATVDAGCASVDDGCGHLLSCSPCQAPEVCRPDGTCGCAPDCTMRACGGDDGCNGVCQTGICAQSGQTCQHGQCACAPGTSRCPDGTCADLQSDPSNCGACGNVCNNGKGCAGGKCLCTEPQDNVDGHCCPSGYDFTYAAGSSTPYCFSTQRPMMTLDNAEAFCAADKACVGFGPPGTGNPAPIPDTAACGSYLAGRVGMLGANRLQSWVETYSNPGAPPTDIGGGVCGCDGGSCTCNSCACFMPAFGCTQRYYCVTDPLAPRRDPCTSSADCQGGAFCDAGTCVEDSSGACCVSAYNCAGMGGMKTCHPTGAGRATGVCR